MIYTLTEAQRQQLLDLALAVVSTPNTMAVKLLQSLAPVDDHIVSVNKMVEPVAWRFDQATYHEDDVRGRGWKVDQFSTFPPAVPWMQRNVVPLYSHPAPLRELSDAEIYKLAAKATTRKGFSEVDFARAVLKAAGGGE